MYPMHRMRRLRQGENLRRLVRETSISVDHLIYPLFVVPGMGKVEQIPSLPGFYRYSVDRLMDEIRAVVELGIPAVLLYGVPEVKEEEGDEAYSPAGTVQRAVRAAKHIAPDLVVMTDVCLCSYTTHGHCGIYEAGSVQNDATLEILQRVALSHAQAGADVVAPSDMMDGRVAAIREALDEHHFHEVGIMASSARYASAYDDPFTQAADVVPAKGDRHAYRMDPANAGEALREVALDIEEGADIVAIQPALAYLDVIRRVKETFQMPVAAHSSAGEYAMVKAAAERGWIDERFVVLENLMAMRRAGADVIVTYHAKDVARWLAAES